MILPWRVVEHLDLTLFKVSKLAEKELNELMEKPIILIPFENEFLKKNPKFFEFCMKKREAHLMYDIICDPKILEVALDRHLHLVLKENYVSIGDYLELSAGHLISDLNKAIAAVRVHIKSCSVFPAFFVNEW